MFRKILRQPRNNRLFRPLIRLRHQIDVALITDLRRPVEFLPQDFPCFLGDLYSSFKVVFAHGGFVRRRARIKNPHTCPLSTVPPALEKLISPRPPDSPAVFALNPCFVQPSSWHSG